MKEYSIHLMKKYSKQITFNLINRYLCSNYCYKTYNAIPALLEETKDSYKPKQLENNIHENKTKKCKRKEKWR